MKKNRLLIAGVLSFATVYIMTACSEGLSVNSGEKVSTNALQMAVSGSTDNMEFNAEISLSDNGITISGSGAQAKGKLLTISSKGTYLITGSINGGQIIVDADDEDKVTLILNGVSITSENSAIYVKNADETTIYLSEDSVNMLSDSVEGFSGDTEEDACIYAKDDITFDGSGTLIVSGTYNHGIHSKDSITINGGKISVTAVNDGIKGKDDVTITNGTITVVSEGDGICSDNDDEEDRGYISISGGNISVTTGGGTSNASAKSDRFFSDESSDSISRKGIKAEQDIMITGGNILLDCCDDAVHSNGSITIDDGEFNIKTVDDGVHANTNLVINGGTATISKSYEGLEGETILITGGIWNITASDDGINAADGGTSNYNNMRNDMFASNDNNCIEISGGYIYVNAEGDGIDSNGDLIISGGEIYIDGPQNNGNGALDIGKSFYMNGGTVAASGSSGMAETPSNQSKQCTIAVYFTSRCIEETVITIKNSSDQEIISYSPSKSFEFILLSSPELTVGDTYTIYEDGNANCKVTLSDVVTSINENGESVNNAFGGGSFERMMGENDPAFNGGAPGFDRGMGREPGIGGR